MVISQSVVACKWERSKGGQEEEIIRGHREIWEGVVDKSFILIMVIRHGVYIGQNLSGYAFKYVQFITL